MIKLNFSHSPHSIALLTLAFIAPISNVQAKTDPHFCADLCAIPGPCEEPSMAEECKKRCGDERIWKKIATRDREKNSKEYRTEEDEAVKERMRRNTPIGRCLALKPKEMGSSLLPSEMSTNIKTDDLCAVALKKELHDLEDDQSALKIQENNLISALKSLEPLSSPTAKKD